MAYPGPRLTVDPDRRAKSDKSTFRCLQQVSRRQCAVLKAVQGWTQVIPLTKSTAAAAAATKPVIGLLGWCTAITRTARRVAGLAVPCLKLAWRKLMQAMLSRSNCQCRRKWVVMSGDQRSCLGSDCYGDQCTFNTNARLHLCREPSEIHCYSHA